LDDRTWSDPPDLLGEIDTGLMHALDL